MSDEPYTNLDLETAEQLLLAAGKPELARALYSHAQGVRNLVQGEWGQSFANSLESILVRHIGPLTASVEGLRSEVATRLGKLEQGQANYNERLDDVIMRLDRKRLEIDEIKRELAELKAWKEAQERGSDADR